MILQCMGGFCGRREACAHFHAPEIPGREPAERLCGRGDEDPQPMVLGGCANYLPVRKLGPLPPAPRRVHPPLGEA